MALVLVDHLARLVVGAQAEVEVVRRAGGVAQLKTLLGFRAFDHFSVTDGHVMAATLNIVCREAHSSQNLRKIDLLYFQNNLN